MSNVTDEEAQLVDDLRALIGRMKEYWPWFSAVWAFDYDDPKPLADLIRGRPIPDKLKGVIADIVLGGRKPNKKAACKMKIPADQQANIFVEDYQERLLRRVITQLSLKTLEADCDQLRIRHVEPIELIRNVEPIEVSDLHEKLKRLYGAEATVLTNIRKKGRLLLNEFAEF